MSLSKPCRYLTALPVYNEQKHVDEVLDAVGKYAQDILVVDDGSSDGTSERLAKRTDIIVEKHEVNRGYGAALKTAFDYAIRHCYDILVTIDCDGQHEPQLIEDLVEECGLATGTGLCQGRADIVSGSRYLGATEKVTDLAPADRRRINHTITAELNDLLGLELTDAFCGFKAYRVDSLKKIGLTESGYAMPLELWVQAAYQKLTIREVPVPLIYLDEERSFGGTLDDANTRLDYYRRIICNAVSALPATAGIRCKGATAL